MGQDNDYPIAWDAEGVMRQQERRLKHEERRPLVRKASDVMGPGFAPHAVTVDDLDDETAAFNGIFYAPAGTLNSPNTAKDWIGETIATRADGGRQTFSTFRAANAPHETWYRPFTYIPGTTVRAYGTWTQVGSGDTRELGIYTAPSATAQSALVTAFPPSTTRPLYVYRSDLDRLHSTRNGIDWTYISGGDTALITPTLATGWAHAGSTGVKYERKGGWVTVFMDYAQRGSGAGSVVFTLPVNFRPASTVPIVGWSAATGGFHPGLVLPSGQVDVGTVSGGFAGKVDFRPVW